MSFFTSKGQALVEYTLLVVFLLVLTSKIIGTFTSFVSDTMGNLGHVLTVHLSSGSCESECFFDGFGNDLN